MCAVLESLAASTDALSRNVTQALRQASVQAGVSFDYLLAKATRESGLDATAKAKTSSATGLFQFIEQTWLRMVKAHGDKYGLASVAGQIETDADGAARVADPETRQKVLALRNDPCLSACMAAELTRENAATLESRLGRKAGGTDLYLAHFLGAGGAAEFLGALKKNPDAKAASLLPIAAAANPGVFYDKSGAPRSLGAIYARLASEFGGKTAEEGASVLVAQGKTLKPKPASPTAPSEGGGSSLDIFLPPLNRFAGAVPSSLGGATSAYALSDTPNTGGVTDAPFLALMLAQASNDSFRETESAGNKDDFLRRRQLRAYAGVG